MIKPIGLNAHWTVSAWGSPISSYAKYFKVFERMPPSIEYIASSQVSRYLSPVERIWLLLPPGTTGSCENAATQFEKPSIA